MHHDDSRDQSVTAKAPVADKIWADPVLVEVDVAEVTEAMGAGGGDEAILS